MNLRASAMRRYDPCPSICVKEATRLARGRLWGLLSWLLVPVAALGGYEESPIPNAGSVTGVVEVHGKIPRATPLQVTKDQPTCGETKANPRLLVTQGRVENAVVWVEGIDRGKPFPKGPFVMDQGRCEYTPHVLLVPAGGEVEFVNDDGILHNVHTFSRKNPPINVAQPKFRRSIRKRFHAPERFGVRCDAHDWMSGIIVVQAHPYYAKSDSEGRFRIEEIPPGEYDLRVWHEALGEGTARVTVEAGASAEVTLQLRKQ